MRSSSRGRAGHTWGISVSAITGDPGTLIATDNPNMEGGAYVATGDYGKLLLVHLRGGMCDGERVLSQVSPTGRLRSLGWQILNSNVADQGISVWQIPEFCTLAQ